nr:MAG TPA: hypothetical protein [Caudoviricetes sp.]
MRDFSTSIKSLNKTYCIYNCKQVMYIYIDEIQYLLITYLKDI